MTAVPAPVPAPLSGLPRPGFKPTVPMAPEPAKDLQVNKLGAGDHQSSSLAASQSAAEVANKVLQSAPLSEVAPVLAPAPKAEAGSSEVKHAP